MEIRSRLEKKEVQRIPGIPNISLAEIESREESRGAVKDGMHPQNTNERITARRFSQVIFTFISKPLHVVKNRLCTFKQLMLNTFVYVFYFLFL